jgi:hypothetical protein
VIRGGYRRGNVGWTSTSAFETVSFSPSLRHVQRGLKADGVGVGDSWPEPTVQHPSLDDGEYEEEDA